MDEEERDGECEKEYEKEDYGDDFAPEWLMPICNSPRMGVCGYEGSDVYPDDCVPDIAPEET